MPGLGPAPDAATPNVAEVLRVSALNVSALKSELARRNLPVTGTKGDLIGRLLEGADAEALRICTLKISELKEELQAKGLMITGVKVVLAARLHAGEDEAGAGRPATTLVGKKAWLQDRANEIFAHSSQRGVLLQAAVDLALKWAKEQADVAAGGGVATPFFTMAVTLQEEAANEERRLLAKLQAVEKKKRVAGDRHGPFYSVALLRQSRLRGKQLDVVVDHIATTRAPDVGPAASYVDRHALLRAMLPPCPIENALRAIELAQPILGGSAQHFAGQVSQLVRRANEDFPDWSEEWKVMYVIDGLDIGYIAHEIGDHRRCRTWMPYADCDRGPGFYFPTNTPWADYDGAAYPTGTVRWLSVLLRAWIFGPYIQQRIGEIILYVRSSVPESFFHRLRINVPKAHHTTDFGMSVGGAKSQLDHNELKRDKVLSAAVVLTKYHRSKGIKVMQAAAPAERNWLEELVIDIFNDIPERVGLGYERLENAAAAYIRRVDFCKRKETEMAAGNLPESSKSRPMPDLEPSAPLRLATGDANTETLVNMHEGLSTAVGTTPMHPFKRRAVVGAGGGAAPTMGPHPDPNFLAAVEALMMEGVV